ncbi:MAG: Uma2 family endonuclease [Cyanobacteriota bacterium]|jgi:Uma2 family endonuclease
MTLLPIAALPRKRLTLIEFLDDYPQEGGRFELRDGFIFTMQPTGTHEQVAGFLALELGIEIKRRQLPFFIPRQGMVKALDSDRSGFIPDVMVLDANLILDEPLWKPRSLITQGKSIPLAIEVVSTNWQDDYLMKLGEYEKLGIGEYWIVDYLGIGGRRYIGSPKQPALSIYTLTQGEYNWQLFVGAERVQSVTFPELDLTAEEIFAQGQ